MKSRLLASLAILTLALAGAFSITGVAQTTEETPAPSDQPSAPMEVGQPLPPQPQVSDIPPNAPPSDAKSNNQPMEAQPGGPSGEEPAKTDLGVARISLIHGDISTQRGDSGDWSAAVLNQPVMGGDKISTGDNARAELQLDFANTFRLGANTKTNIVTFTHKDIQIQLSQGLANYTVSKDSEAEPEIDTPNVSVHPAHHDGVFRIEIQPNGDTTVIVRKGEAQIATPQGSTVVRSGEMATVRGTTESAQYKISNAPDPDDWDRWNADRDHMIHDAQSWRHTNRYYTGTQDLDAYGRWENVPDYGDVWVPNEPRDWAPYRDGNWVYEPYYGWTWVGYEPWGWVPYHYGRWFWYGGGWAWWPGPVWGWYRPFWAPAYVSFWGWGWGWGVGFGWGGWGWGGFGWLPIGPCDWFHPWWGGYRGRFGVFGPHVGGWGRFGGFGPLHDGTRFSNINNIHNEHIFRGMSTVNANHFGAGGMRPVAVTREQFNGARQMAGNLPVVPSRASLSASGRAAAPSTVRNGGSERFFGSVHNNVAHTESFQHETASLRQTMQQNRISAISAGGRMNGGESGFARSTNPAGSMQRPNAGTGGFQGGREMNNPVSRNAGNPASSTPNANRGAYRPFTPPNSSNTRPAGGSGFEPRATNQSAPATSTSGFRPFTPPSRSGSGGAVGTSPERGSGTYWNRTAPSSMPSTRGYSDGYGRGSFSGGSRPQLDMRQPIVRPPSYGGYSRGSRPSSGGSRGGSHPSSGSGGHSSGGGGHASGGGGGHAGGGHR